jgi:hypothetical protein
VTEVGFAPVRHLAPLVVVAVLVVLAGCGSASENSSSAPDGEISGRGSLTKAEFVAKADALCEASKVKREPIWKELEEATLKARGEEQGGGIADGTRRELAQMLGRIVAIAEDSQSQVKALGVPKAGAAQLEAISRKTEAAFEASLAYGAALEQGEDAQAQAIAERANVETREVAGMAKRYGFEVCGSQP